MASGVSLKWPNLTIERSGKTYSWRCPDNADLKTPLVSVDGVEGVIIRGIKFDGGNKIETLIQLHGKCPGLTLQDLSLTNFKSNGIRSTSTEGAADRPIVFNKLNIVPRGPAQTGLLFDLDPPPAKPRPNQWFRLLDCKSGNAPLNASVSTPNAVEHIEPTDLFSPKSAP